MGRVLIILGIGAAVVLTACGTRELGVVDKIQLGRTAMRFDHKGAEIADCRLVSQFERGRSSAAGGGGAG